MASRIEVVNRDLSLSVPCRLECHDTYADMAEALWVSIAVVVYLTFFFLVSMVPCQFEELFGPVSIILESKDRSVDVRLHDRPED